jgi:hypothetical protein
MANPDWKIPGYPELKGNVGQAAVNGQIVYYPQVVRSDTDTPVDRQAFGMVTLNLLPEPREVTVGNTKTKIYGFLKLRGNWADVDQCTAKAAAIVREQDSKNFTRIAHVGYWLPICDSECLSKEVVSVGAADEPEDQRRAREKLSRKKHAEQAKYEKEIRDREEEIKNAPDHNDDPLSIDYYTMKRVLAVRLDEQISQFQKKLDGLTAARDMNNNLVYALDQLVPNHQNSWIDNYNKEARNAGVADFVEPEATVQQHATFVSTPEALEDTLKKIEELRVKAAAEVERAKKRAVGNYDSDSDSD